MADAGQVNCLNLYLLLLFKVVTEEGVGGQRSGVRGKEPLGVGKTSHQKKKELRP